MTPIDIIIAVCLGVAPGLAGITIGLLLVVAYDKAVDRWNSFVIRWDYDERFLKIVNIDQVQTRQTIIFCFWTVVGLALGGFAAGCYVESYLGLTWLLSGFVPVPSAVC